MWSIIGNIINKVVGTIINPIPLFEWLIISDGIFSSINFIITFNRYKKIKNDINDWSEEYKERVITGYGSLYKIEYMDRYILYLLVYIFYIVVTFCLSNNIYMYICCSIITIPYVQNRIYKIGYIKDIIKEFSHDKRCFVKYTLSKLTIKCIKELDVSIKGIKNYHIFILYKYISFEYLYDFIKSYMFTYLLFFLRNSKNMYYYYKAIKVAYYYNTNYMFNIMSKDDAINNINTVIKEKRWKDMTNMENVHSLYTLIQYKFNNKNNKYDIQLYSIYFITFWSLICTLKVINYYISLLIYTIFIIIYIQYNIRGIILHNYRFAFTIFIIYSMLILGVNDLLITIVCINYKTLYYIYSELKFYIQNKKDIKKVLNFYKLNVI